MMHNACMRKVKGFLCVACVILKMISITNLSVEWHLHTNSIEIYYYSYGIQMKTYNKFR